MFLIFAGMILEHFKAIFIYCKDFNVKILYRSGMSLAYCVTVHVTRYSLKIRNKETDDL